MDNVLIVKISQSTRSVVQLPSSEKGVKSDETWTHYAASNVQRLPGYKLSRGAVFLPVRHKSYKRAIVKGKAYHLEDVFVSEVRPREEFAKGYLQKV